MTTIGAATDTPNSTQAFCLPPDLGGREYVWSMTSDLQDIVDADPALITELLALFLDDSAIRLQILRGACASEDVRLLRTQAHSLKGSALQIGASGLASLCAILEMSESLAPEQSGAMTSAINGEFALVRRAIEEYVAGTETGGALPEKRTK